VGIERPPLFAVRQAGRQTDANPSYLTGLAALPAGLLSYGTCGCKEVHFRCTLHYQHAGGRQADCGCTTFVCVCVRVCGESHLGAPTLSVRMVQFNATTRSHHITSQAILLHPPPSFHICHTC
jgi:hypothetical protein